MNFLYNTSRAALNLNPRRFEQTNLTNSNGAGLLMRRKAFCTQILFDQAALLKENSFQINYQPLDRASRNRTYVTRVKV